MIKKQVVKSCCGKQSYLYQTDKPIKKNHVSFFTNAGFSAPENFQKHGIFYIRHPNLTATSPFGGNKITVRCWGTECDHLLQEFVEILEKAINSD